MCKVRSRLALLLRFYNVFCVEAIFEPLGHLGGFFVICFKDFIIFVENGVRETAVRVHFGPQNCSENVTFVEKCYHLRDFLSFSHTFCVFWGLRVSPVAF